MNREINRENIEHKEDIQHIAQKIEQTKEKIDFSNKEYWEKLADGKINNLQCARLVPDDTPKFILKLLTEFEIDVTRFCFDRHSGLILDAGCGNGNILMHVQELFPKNNINYVGLDFSRNMLKRAIERANEKSNISLLQGNITELPFMDETFDRIITSGVVVCLGSLNEIEETIKECFRVLKPDGVLIIDFFKSDSPIIMAKLILHISLPNPPKNIPFLWFVKELRKAKFSILEYRRYDFKPIWGYLFMNRWKHSGFVQEKLSNFIEKNIIPHMHITGLGGRRVYIKCIK